MNTDFLNELNEAQRAAAMQTEGPVMIIAGAGSGKTKTLTYRIAHILGKGTDPFRVLALTFTNKAAREMKERITALIGDEGKSVWMGTFHAIFARILRTEAEHLGYPKSFVIYDTDDSKNLIKRIVKEQNLDPKTYTASYVAYRISMAKGNLISPDEYENYAEICLQDKAAGKPLTANLYKLYNARLKQSGAMDFDDLLFNMNVLLRDFPEILYKYQQRFKYLLVDEYQDTNYAQYLIIKKLAANNENICVVGDDAQSIYAFRGANIQNILNFKHDYPSLKTFKLEQNYRSTKNIVGAANELIKNNKDQIFKEIWTENQDGEKIHVIKAGSDSDEGTKVAQHIFEQHTNTHIPYSGFAVLYRTNNQSRSIEEALRRRNIPYRIHGGLSFYDRREVKDVLAYFRLVVNPRDEEALMRVINYPTRGIGQTTIDRIRLAANHFGKPLWDIVKQPGYLGETVNSPTKARIEAFALMIESFHIQLTTQDVYELANQIWLNSGIMRALKEEDPIESEARLDNVEELLNAVKEFSEQEQTYFDEETGEVSELQVQRHLDEFLQEISLMTDADQKDESDVERVQLMTIHAAKGLEFPYVFVVGMEENLFPSPRSLNTRAELEEERRLFYVAITRAEKQLYLSYAQQRFMYGNHQFCEPSRFLEELDERYLSGNLLSALNHQLFDDDFEERTFKPKPKFVPQNLKKLNPTPQAVAPEAITGNTQQETIISDYVIGMKVKHATFGEGEIMNIEGNADNQKVMVQFPVAGTKTLLVKFARLIKI